MIPTKNVRSEALEDENKARPSRMGGSNSKHGWRYVARPVPRDHEEFKMIRPMHVVAMLGYLATLNLNSNPELVVAPFDVALKGLASSFYNSLKGMEEQEMRQAGVLLGKARELCWQCRETLQIAHRTMIREKLILSPMNCPFVGDDLNEKEQKALFKLFRQIDEHDQGHIRPKDLREWVSKESVSVSESMFIDFLFSLTDTKIRGFARVEEFALILEQLVIMRDPQLCEFAFSAFMEITDGDGIHLDLNKLAACERYFSSTTSNDKDCLNDKFLNELMARCTDSRMTKKEFFMICQGWPLSLFPLKWLQTTMGSFKGLELAMQSRRVLFHNEEEAEDLVNKSSKSIKEMSISASMKKRLADTQGGNMADNAAAPHRLNQLKTQDKETRKLQFKLDKERRLQEERGDGKNSRQSRSQRRTTTNNRRRSLLGRASVFVPGGRGSIFGKNKRASFFKVAPGRNASKQQESILPFMDGGGKGEGSSKSRGKPPDIATKEMDAMFFDTEEDSKFFGRASAFFQGRASNIRNSLIGSSKKQRKR